MPHPSLGHSAPGTHSPAGSHEVSSPERPGDLLKVTQLVNGSTAPLLRAPPCSLHLALHLHNQSPDYMMATVTAHWVLTMCQALCSELDLHPLTHAPIILGAGPTFGIFRDRAQLSSKSSMAFWSRAGALATALSGSLCGKAWGHCDPFPLPGAPSEPPPIHQGSTHSVIIESHKR